jgi:S-adenosylmethionine decarboxylase
MDRFEGPEKKLEIILSVPQTGLRDNSDGRWDRVVRASGAEILKRKYGKKLDGYLLSESSLFVWDDRILIITCGRTTPVLALPVILDYVSKDRIACLFYERKNLNFPDDQPAAFEDDQIYLSSYLPGKSIMMGSALRDYVHVFYYADASVALASNASLQIFMHDIDPKVARAFFYQHANTAQQEATLAKLTGLYPMMDIDSHFFYPQGYSLNGIADTKYYTVHVTPQPEASYASFESNLIGDDSGNIIAEVVSIFKPRRYCLMVRTSDNGKDIGLQHSLTPQPSGYRGMDHIRHEFDGHYQASFSSFLKQRH